MITRRLGILLSIVVLVASGAYLIVYLYRWEWNRALVAGIFFVAAEVAIVATALFRKLQAIESRLDAQDAQRLERIREAAPEPRTPFAWLDPTKMNVFVPVLLGAGVILSVLAHGVERLAGATATPVRERALADRLGAIALPTHGLLPSDRFVGLGPLRVVTVPPRWATTRTVVTRGFGLLLAAFLTVVAIEVIADETQDRPDAPITSGSAEVVLQVDNRFTGRSKIRTAEALFVACRHTLTNRHEATGFAQVVPGQISFTVTPDFGEHAGRRFEGCLEDALFDRVSASVLSLAHRP